MSDRPIECGQCKRPVKVLYKEIIGTTITCSEMCVDCPILQQKLHGEKHAVSEKKGELCCGTCGTSLESVRTGQPLGCPDCYTVFNDFLVNELIQTDSLPPAFHKKQRTQTLHLGKAPGKPVDITLSSRLAALSEALNDALKRENYEQAALLRDQIKALTEKKS